MKNANRKFHPPLLGLVVGLFGLVSTGVASRAIAAVPETRQAGAVSRPGKPPVNPVAECIKRANATNKANNDAINQKYNSAVKAANSAQQSAAKAANDAYDSAAKTANEAQRAAIQSAEAARAASVKAADQAFAECTAHPPFVFAVCQQAQRMAVLHASEVYTNTIIPVNVGLARVLTAARDKRDAAVKDSQGALTIALKAAKDALDKVLALEKNRHEAALKDCRSQSL